MINNDIGMILADTSRSRFYIQSMMRNNLLPSYIIILRNEKDVFLPGQINYDNDITRDTNPIINDDAWSEINNNIFESIYTSIEHSGANHKIFETTDIHSSQVISEIKDRSESVFIYSGYGGVILKKEIFDTGKKFLHVHGGYLPNYKGSTTNYYSLIDSEYMGASSLFLNENIDSGPIIHRRKFNPPVNRKYIDHIYDNAARAKVLIETLNLYETKGNFEIIHSTDMGEKYYVIHPILKHIAIIGRNSN